jgi:CotS family spore coat protein
LSSWIGGREADYSRKEDLKIAAKTLAELHRCSRGFIPPPWAGRIKWGTWPENMTGKKKDLIDFKEQAALLNRKTFFDQVFLAYADDAIMQCEEALEMLVTGGYAEVDREDVNKKYFCHHDFACHNLLIDRRGEGFVIDFDYCIADIRCHDLSSLLLRVGKRNSWDCRKSAYAFSCYDRIGKVSDREKSVIAALLHFPQDFWQVAFAFYVEKDQPLVRLERRIRNWVLEKRQRDFSLRRLAKMI